MFFWLHLAAGTVGGLVILVMSFTGVLLMYERQMIEWADRGFRVTPGAQRLPVTQILEKVRDQKQALPAAITLRADPSAPAMLTFGANETHYADPYTGALLGVASTGTREFFRALRDWHRWLGQTGESRATARAITGACNLAFLFIVCSGLYLWFPRKWAWQYFKQVMLFRGGLNGKARDFNWHNVIGFWSCVPLFFVVITATLISYSWATNLLYTLTGSEAPAPAQAPGADGRKGGDRATTNLDLSGIDQLWVRAEQQVPGWRSINLRLPGSNRAPFSFLIDRGDGGQPQKRATLTLARSGEVVRWEDFESNNLGRRLRLWGRFVHTGEAFGIPGQTIAGIASAGGVVLVWTGIALALRRFRAWRARKEVREVAMVGR